MGTTTAQQDAHAVKDGIKHKDVYVTAVGDTAKAYFCLKSQIRKVGFYCQLELF